MVTLIRYKDGRIEHWSGCAPCPMLEEGTMDMVDKDCGIHTEQGIPLDSIDLVSFSPNIDEGDVEVGLVQTYDSNKS